MLFEAFVNAKAYFDTRFDMAESLKRRISDIVTGILIQLSVGLIVRQGWCYFVEYFFEAFAL